MLGAAPLGGGFASRAVSYAAGSQLRDTARQHLPAWAGGQPTSSNEQPAQAESRTGTRLRQAATLAGASATGGATGAAAAAAAAERAPGRRGRRRVGRVDRHRSRRRRERALVHAAADGAGQRRRTRRQRRAADSELSRAGLRQRDVRGQVPRAHQPRVRRAGHGGPPVPAGGHPARDRPAGLRARRGRARAPRLPGARRMVIRRSAKRCARSPPPAPRSAPKRSATSADTGDQHDGWTPAGAADQERRASSSEALHRSAPPGRRRHRSRRAPAARASRRRSTSGPGAPPGRGGRRRHASPAMDRPRTTGELIRCAPRQPILSRSFGSGI